VKAPTPELENYLSESGLSRVLDVSAPKLNRLVRLGLIRPSARLGRMKLFKADTSTLEAIRETIRAASVIC
jgi:hypothetical protein